MTTMESTGINITGLTQRQITTAMRRLDKARKKYEDLSEYEYCAELRDFIRALSDYALGYRDLDGGVCWALYYTCSQFGYLEFLTHEEDDMYSATFVLDTIMFTFYLDGEEGSELKKLFQNDK